MVTLKLSGYMSKNYDINQEFLLFISGLNFEVLEMVFCYLIQFYQG